MSNESVENLINQYFNFDDIYYQIKHQSTGVLYRIINLLYQDLSQEVCDYFEVRETSPIEDDFKIAYDNIAKPLLIDKIDIIKISIPNRRIPKISRYLGKQTFTNFCLKLEDKQKMRILVFTAFILIAGVAFIKWKSSTPNQSPKSSRKQPLNTRKTPVIDQSITTAICLVVPASDVSNLSVKQSINRDEILKLIDAASYFLCIQKNQASKLPVEIDENQTPSPDSKLKFYLRIDIPDGKAIINQKTKYVIKRDLPSNTQGEIKELGRLTNVSTISSFNRI